MAKGKGAIQGWITKNGIHIPIYGTYTVREGHEPTAKGAKFKSGKVTAKTVSKALKKEYDEDSKETWYEGKINGKDVRITQEIAGSDKFWNVDIGKPGNRHKLLTDNNEPMSFKSLEDAHDEIAHELNSGDKSTNASKGKQEKDKYANRDWNKDVDDAKRYGYSEQTEEGKKPVTKAEEEKQTRQSFKDKKAQEQGFADDASMRSYNEETGVNKETWKATPESYAQSKGKSIRDIAQEVNNNDVARATANQLMKDGRTYEEAAALAHSDMERGTLKGQASSTSSFSPESSAQTINDMQRRRVNGGGKNDDWKTAQSVLESAPAGTTMIQTGDRGVKFQYTKGDDGIWHSSAGEEYNSDSKKLSMSWVGDSGPRVEFTTSDKAMSNEDIKASQDRAVSGRLNQSLGLDRNNRPIGNRSVPKVDTSSTSTSKSYPWTKSTAEPGASSLTKSGYTPREKKQVLSNDAKSGTAGPRRAVNFSEMSVSGLRQAFEDAPSAQKTKIRAELRKRGYSYVGGKWVKGRKE